MLRKISQEEIDGWDIFWWVTVVLLLMEDRYPAPGMYKILEKILVKSPYGHMYFSENSGGNPPKSSMD